MRKGPIPNNEVDGRGIDEQETLLGSATQFRHDGCLRWRASGDGKEAGRARIEHSELIKIKGSSSTLDINRAKYAEQQRSPGGCNEKSEKMKQVQTTPRVPLRHSEFDRPLSCATSANQPVENPLKPRYSCRSLETPATVQDKPNQIALCVTCRSKDLSEESHFFWLWKRSRFVCNECGTTLQQVGDKYKLARVADTGGAVWRKYAGKALRSREWANIANGGLSDEEITASWNGSRFLER